MDSIARVFLVTGESKAVRYDDETTVERVLHVVLNGIGIAPVAFYHFALRLLVGPSPRNAGDSVWLHPCLLVSHLRHSFAKHLLASTCPQELRFELRLRFVPQSVFELQWTEANAFSYLHDQVFDDFLSHVAWKASLDPAIELAALKVCRDYSERQAKTCIDHKIDIDGIDIESAIQTFIPNTVLCNPNVKPAVLKKHFISLLKKFAPIPFNDSIVRSLTILVDIVKFDVEVFKASMGVGWSNPVDLLVGPEVGISYRINERCEVSRLAELRSVLEITIRRMEGGSEKTIVTLKLSGTAQPMMVTVATYDMAESLAHLIDGYQMMFTQGVSVFKYKGLARCESSEMQGTSSLPRTVKLPPPPQANGGSTSNVDQDLRIRREHVTLKELIGGGQFGNVYKGVLAIPGTSPVTVAIKVCKMENEPADTQLILQESHLMKRLRHDHIISLVGVCTDSPMWLIMELAPLGELRQYLQANRTSLDLSTLMLFGLQVSRALQYLHALSFVHRDVAARNVLVATPTSVKLTDFGLSRALDYDAVYTASRGKLPIKWLAPESINYREFSMASDVWMYGVFLWEVLSWGVKPWMGVANADVISQIEAGDRPPCPDTCPLSLYNYLERAIWAAEPQKRPTTAEITKVIESICDQLQRRVTPEEIRVFRTTQVAPVIVTNITSMPNLTLWKTLEDQKRQAEEDEKWLEEQEDLTTYDPNGEDHELNNGDEVSSMYYGTYNGTNGNNIALEAVRRACSAVVFAVTHLHSSFNNQMKHDDFVVSIRDITAKLREMFAESTEVLCQMEDVKRHEVEMTEALIGNDMRQMSKAMHQLVDNVNHTSYNVYRRDIVRIAKELSTNCENFLCLLENNNQRQTTPDFKAILSDC